MRHGEALSNIKNIVNSNPQKSDLYPLTLKGRVEVQKTAAKLKKEKIDLIFSSDFVRAKETAEILAKDFGIKKIIFDKRIREINTGIFDSRPSREYHAYFSSYADKFSKRPAGGENLKDLAARLYDFLNYLEKNYSGKKILIVSHEYPIWMMETIMSGRDELGAIKEKERRDDDFIAAGEAREVPYLIVPRDDFGFGDLHRPYVDKIILKCSKCGGKMKRVEEVIDVWFDSGAMPFAQSHWPFEKKIDFPADYIAEGVDQTRGWFYTLLAVAALLGRRAPYKNVISLGHVLDKNGQKMSKSKGNVVDPWQMIQKYGADVVRWYFYTINPPGEPKKFDEADLSKTSRQFISLLYNSFVFLNTYDIYVRGHKSSKLKISNAKVSRANILDRWIITRLNETILLTTDNLEKYDIGGAAKALENFVGDLSRWYIRRSRRRFQKPASEKDYRAATGVLTHVLKEISKLLSPFTPFFAEALYQSIKRRGEDKSFADSVHWASWPKTKKSLIDKKLLSEMAEIRRLASLVLAKRAAAGIKVRQPLALLRIRPTKVGIQKNSQLINLLKEETNVKNIVFDPELQEEIWLDTTLTHELKEEGWLREFIRIVQDLRQDARFSPQEKLILLVEAPEELVFILRKNEKLVKSEVNVKAVEYSRSEKFTAELATKLDQWPIWVGLRKPL
jgi:isoleucyl-tRNA synthetase